jgi:hypothetical protein
MPLLLVWLWIDEQLLVWLLPVWGWLFIEVFCSGVEMLASKAMKGNAVRALCSYWQASGAWQRFCSSR